MKEFLEGKVPLANYDIVVYLGGGTFALPIINFYFVKPLKLQLSPDISSLTGVVGELANLVAFLFVVYIIGQVVSYFSSIFIERTFHYIAGYPAETYLDKTRDPLAKDWELVYRRLSHFKKEHLDDWRAIITNGFVRGITFLPLAPLLAIVLMVRWFGFYASKVPLSQFVALEKRYRLAFDGNEIDEDKRWAKRIEYYVAHCIPNAFPRMYNYLIISGLMRSVSFILLCTCWCHLLSPFIGYYDGTVHFNYHIEHFYFSEKQMLKYVILSVLSTVSIMMFAKFNRRYFEESIWAFSLAPEKNF